MTKYSQKLSRNIIDFFQVFFCQRICSLYFPKLPSIVIIQILCNKLHLQTLTNGVAFSYTSQVPNFSMAIQTKTCWFFSNVFLFLVGSFLVFLFKTSFYSTSIFNNASVAGDEFSCEIDPPEPTFYDDPNLSYSIERRMENWDHKRKTWLDHHCFFSAGAGERILLVTGSQPSSCENPIGDHLLLRLFKNKVDYCRIHGHEIFYNNAYLQPQMGSYWAKLPIIRAAMLAHPEVEWIWWMDSDAVFTDMEFKVPLERYKDHNLVVHGWPNMVYEDRDNKSWTGLNAGVFLIRNCQWSMELMDSWANMGPQSPDYKKWGPILTSTFKDKQFPLPDDQSGLIYLISKDRRKWGDKVYLEWEYYLESHWIGVVESYDIITCGYREMEKREVRLRRRHAERVSRFYGGLREPEIQKAGFRSGAGRRPFVTHFAGCQPCSGNHNPTYDGDTCWKEIGRALNFADNQVLRTYGFVHSDLSSSAVYSLPFDYPHGE
ncbi:glycosyltransferase 6-like [Benincasa hispida]|uniref:glycosyltransferase 6-like n=1 Tax=Benincasa hispida TaxID=102211 RepID=UPI001901810F|nr:glycosyltransferase 6-like [Benincasa hispida]